MDQEGPELSEGLEQTAVGAMSTRSALDFHLACKQQPAMMTAALVELFPDLVALFEEVKRLQGMLAEMRTLAQEAAKEFRELTLAVHQDTDDIGKRFSVISNRMDRAAKLAAKLEAKNVHG